MLAHLINDPDGPKFFKVGQRIVVYAVEDLDAWALSRMKVALRYPEDRIPAGTTRSPSQP